MIKNDLMQNVTKGIMFNIVNHYRMKLLQMAFSRTTFTRTTI
jgi:hypothetical protein